VTIVPSDAIGSGALWEVDSGLPQPNGATVTNLAVGTHTITFRTISGWAPPASQTVTVTDGGITSASGRYFVLTTPNDGIELLTNGSGTIQHSAWTSSLLQGFRYSVKAVAKPGNIFVNWTGGVNLPYQTLSTNAAYTFLMESNIVLQANFSTNSFVMGKGTYRGLFAPEFSPRTHTNSGSFVIEVSGAGGFSGNLLLGGADVPVAGKFSQSGFAKIVTKRGAGQSPVTTFLQLDFTNQAINGIVSNDTFSADLTGNQDVFSRENPASAFMGQYTFIIPGQSNAAVGPFGDSYGIVNIDDTGKVKLTGSLADGTTVSESGAISKDGYWPLYIKLYGGKGSLWGWNYVLNRTLNSSPLLSWISETNSARSAVGRAGFTNQAANLTGGIYVTNFYFPSGMPITLAGGNLENPITVTNFPDSATVLTLETNKKTGVISGTFANPSDPAKTVKFNVVIVEGLGQAAGYFLGPTQSGSIKIGPQ
jgi:hypothetical protein